MKRFNTEGPCNREKDYMVNIEERIRKIREMIARGNYFCMNRSRQYGKTTTLKELRKKISAEYMVIFLDFQIFGADDFKTEKGFALALAEVIERQSALCGKDDEERQLRNKVRNLRTFFDWISLVGQKQEKKQVLMIDEVDNATNNQVFLDFLSGLRYRYINRDEEYAFQSVILAGVTDIKNMKEKISDGESHRENSPWNIAVDFDVDMSLSEKGIADMLCDYKNDHQGEMDTDRMAALLHEYTSGHPYLVSKLCKLLDEKVMQTIENPWTKEGFLMAVRMLLKEKNSLFESLSGKLYGDKKLHDLVYQNLMNGKEIPYNALNHQISTAVMYGFIKERNSQAVISNRIFEEVLYDLFLSEQVIGSKIYDSASIDKNQFVDDGHLNMELVLKKFIETFNYYYGDKNMEFLEDVGRNYFLLFLKPIINGTGNIYIEAETRNRKRTDVIIDYLGEQFIIECKIWHGEEYHLRGERQLSEYLDYYHLKKGYMLSFNFNKKKKIGIVHIEVEDKVLVEAVV